MNVMDVPETKLEPSAGALIVTEGTWFRNTLMIT
jgi:hypothetical protein